MNLARAKRSDDGLGLVPRRELEHAHPDPARTGADVHQDYLDALPIAAAIVSAARGVLDVSAANAPFARLDEGCRLRDRATTLLDDPRLEAAITGFLAGRDPALEFEWADGASIAGHHFTVRLGRLEPGDDRGPRCLLSLVDRTVEIENERSLRAEMLRDSLTGLPNRAAFSEAVEAAMGAQGDPPAGHAVIVVDLTRFSRVNECMGGMAGDELIATVARRLLGTLRAGDILARLGGDEFAVLMRAEAGSDEAGLAARRIHATLATPFRLSELEIGVDCAIGIATANGEAASAEELVRSAQFALKRAKLSGKIEVYRAGDAVAARRRFSIESELRRAIENDRLTLAFQPLIDLATGAISGFEALARWHHDERGLIQPSEFIPVAEESGLIVPLGRWALERALGALAGWDAAAGKALPLHVAVNLSAIQVARDDIAGAAERLLTVCGLAGDRLTLELTESAIIQDPERAGRVLNALKALDAKMAMDDFGTGYSNLAYLQSLPIDVLKIDRSFITGMLADRDKVAIVRAVLGLADALGMSTTAEGIETVELSQTLAVLGCSHGQGFYFAEPLPADAAFAYWRARSA